MENSRKSQKEVGRRKYDDRRSWTTLFSPIAARRIRGRRRQLFSLESIAIFRNDALGQMIFRIFGNNLEQLSYGFVEPF